ncbi:MAG: phosphate acetyltransferase [Pseudomonadota bacterium]
MSKNLYITATEALSGKSAISLGVMETLLRNIRKVGFFRPFISTNPDSGKRDNDIELIRRHFNLDFEYHEMFAYSTSEIDNLLSSGKQEELLDTILVKYQAMEKKCDFILCEGTDFVGSSSSFEFDVNAEVANNLGCPVLLVASANSKTASATFHAAELAFESFAKKGCHVIATVVNRCPPDQLIEIENLLKAHPLMSKQLIFPIPNIPVLGKPTIGEIAKITNAKILYGEDKLQRHVHGYSIAAMRLPNFLERVEHGSLVIVPGDRADILLGCLAAEHSRAMPDIAGIMITGGLYPGKSIIKVMDGFPKIMPVLMVETDTFPTASFIDNLHAVITPENVRKISHVIGIFDQHVNNEELSDIIIKTQTTTITPKMFEYRMLHQAKKYRQTIVLPEGEDERILKAAEILVRRDVVDLILLGNADRIREKASEAGVRLNGLDIVDPESSDMLDGFSESYYDLRKHKGVTPETAWETMLDVSYFGTMMIHKGFGDGMVSGAVHTTGATIRPAFEFVKTKPGISVVSSVFFMCLEDRVLVYGDCAINPMPDAAQLAQIAISSARTARAFGIEPRVAMLSYSTGQSGTGEDVDKVRQATQLAQQIAIKENLDILIEGPIQYDAAIDPDVAKTKMPDSKVAGRATVFIFPDLNTGNNTYKAVQRSAKAVAVGPILQGLNKPVNDLSRGCQVPDIINTVIITAIQAQAEKGLL